MAAITSGSPLINFPIQNSESYPSELDFKELNSAISTYTKEQDTQKITSFLNLCPESIRSIIITNCNQYVDLFGEKSILYLIRILMSEFYQEYLKVIKKTDEISKFLDELYFCSLQSLEYLKEITLDSSEKTRRANVACQVTQVYFEKSLEYKDNIIRSKPNFQTYSKFGDLFTLIQTLNNHPDVLEITIGEIAQFQPETVPTNLENVIRKVFKNFKFDYTKDRIERMYRYVSLTTKNEDDQLFSTSARQNTLKKLQGFFENLINSSKIVTDKYFLNQNEQSIEFDDLEHHTVQILKALPSDEHQLFQCFYRFSFSSVYFDLFKKVMHCNHFKLNPALHSQSFDECVRNYRVFFFCLPASEENTFALLNDPIETDKEILRTSLILPLLKQTEGCKRLYDIGFFSLLKKYILQFTEASKNKNSIKAAIYFSRFQMANIVLLTTYSSLLDAYQQINIEEIKSQFKDTNLIQAVHDLNIYYKAIEKILLRSMLFIWDFEHDVQATKKKKKKKKKTHETKSPPKTNLAPQPNDSEDLKKKSQVNLTTDNSPSETISPPPRPLKSLNPISPPVEKKQKPIRKFEVDEEEASFERVLNRLDSLRSYLKPHKFLEFMKKEFDFTLVNSNGKHLKLEDKLGHKIPFPGSSKNDLKLGTARAIIKEAHELTFNP